MTTSNGEANAYGLTTPDSWWNTTLEEVCSGDGGRIQTGPFGSQLHAHDYRDEGTPVVMPKQLGDNMISTDGIARISDEDVERLSRHKLCEGDIVFSRRGDVTRRSYITKDEEGWLCGTGCMLIRPSHEKLLNEFLALFFSLPQFKDYITLNAVGATMPNLNTKILQNIPLFLPSRATQRKIVAVITAYDDLIENNTRRIAILEEMAQAIYREWFVKFRFPGHENAKMVDSPLGQIPEGWEVGKLEDVLVLQRGFDLPKKHRVAGDVPIYASTGVTGLHNEAKVEGPGVLTGRSGSLGTVTYIHEDFWPLNTTLWIKKFKWGTPVFAFYVLSGIDFETFNSGAAVPSLNRNNVHGLPTLLPKSEVIAAFDEIAIEIFDQVKLLHRKNENLRTTRDLLLPKLISGKLDVEDLDIDTGLPAEVLEEAAV